MFSEVGRVFVGNGEGCWGDVSLTCWLDSSISLEKLLIEYQSIEKSINILNEFNSFSECVYARLYVSRCIVELLNNEKEKKK